MPLTIQEDQAKRAKQDSQQAGFATMAVALGVSELNRRFREDEDVKLLMWFDADGFLQWEVRPSTPAQENDDES